MLSGAAGQVCFLNRSRVLKPIDDTPCGLLFVSSWPVGNAAQGMLPRLIAATVEYAGENGATVIETYPTLPRQGRLPPVSSFMGIPAFFEQLGFEECRRPSTAKVIMRYSFSTDD